MWPINWASDVSHAELETMRGGCSARAACVVSCPASLAPCAETEREDPSWFRGQRTPSCTQLPAGDRRRSAAGRRSRSQQLHSPPPPPPGHLSGRNNYQQPRRIIVLAFFCLLLTEDAISISHKQHWNYRFTVLVYGKVVVLVQSRTKFLLWIDTATVD